jgi:hypothetical protein
VDSELYQEEEIPNHLVSMVQILLDEERQTKDIVEQETLPQPNNQINDNMPIVSSPVKFHAAHHYQPCLEFFVQKKIMETLCMVALKDVGYLFLSFFFDFEISLIKTEPRVNKHSLQKEVEN